MKKILVFALLLTPVVLKAQFLTLGPKAGVNFSTQTGSQYETIATHFMYGDVLNYQIIKNLELQGEFLFTQKGYREEYQGDVIFDQLTANYLEVPAMAKGVINTNLFNYFVGGGVYWSYWTRGRYQSSVDGSETIYEDYVFVSEPDADGYKDVRNDFGVVGEVGFKYDGIGSGMLMFGIRYSHGLVATNQINPEPAGWTPRKNKVITISLSYLLFL